MNTDEIVSLREKVTEKAISNPTSKRKPLLLFFPSTSLFSVYPRDIFMDVWVCFET